MSIPIDQTLLGAVQHLVPMIRAHAQEAESTGRLAKPVLTALTNAGLFRLLTPQSLGGLETDPLTCARIIEEVSRADSAAGWALVNPLAYAWFSARLPDRSTETIFGSDPHVLIAGPMHPPMQAIPVVGGYRITGRAPLVSNCHDATWIAVTAQVQPVNAPRTPASGEAAKVVAFCARADCEILHTWSAMGMRGTDSHDIAVSELFIPAERTFAMVPTFTPGTHYQGPLYRLPFMGLVAAIQSPVMLAMAREAIDTLVALAHDKVPFASTTVLREKAAVQASVAQAEAALQAARALLYNTLAETWERTCTGEPSSLSQKATLLLASTNAIQSGVKAVELMYNASGTTGIYTASPLERLFRDSQVLKQQALTAESRWETAGQVYLGLPPDFVMVGF